MKECSICHRSTDKKGKPLRFARHHLSYSDDIKVLLCHQCHRWLHGSFGKYKNYHPFIELYGDLAPKKFAWEVYKLYEENNV